MNADTDHSRSARRPRPEVAVYRPGSGPLKKSSSNVENIQPGSSSQGSSRTDIEVNLVTSFRTVHLTEDGNKSKESNAEVHAQESKTRSTKLPRHERNPVKPKTEIQHNHNVVEKREEQRNKSSTSKQGKHQQHLPEKKDSGSSQDLRQLLIEKRLQRNNEISAAGNTESNATVSQANGKQRSDNRQPTKSREELKNGHYTVPIPPNNGPKSLSIESSSNFTRQGDKRSSGKRRNDRKPRLENSHSEGHLVAFTNNNSPSTATHQPCKEFEEKNVNLNDFDKSRNGREKKEGSVRGGRRKRNNRGHGGSRRGSVSSEAGTPVPETSWANEPNRLRADDEKSVTSNTGGRGGPSRSRHTSSPQRNPSRNGVADRIETNTHAIHPVSPTTYLRPATIMSPPPSPGLRQSSEPPVHPAFQQRNNGRDHRSMDRPHHVASHESTGYRNEGRPPSGRSGSRSDRPSLPSNYDSLPPRLKKKYEEDRLLQSMANSDRVPPIQQASQSGSARLPDAESSLRTFLNATGPPVRPILPHPFPQPTSPNAPPSVRPQLWTPGVKAVQSGRVTGGLKSQVLSSEQEDADVIYARPRSQDSMSGGFSDHGRDRKTSVTDSRSSTPSSSVDCTSGQNLLRGTLRRLEEVSATQTSLDWSEEMEEEDKRSLAGTESNHRGPGSKQQPTARIPSDVVFASADIRYQNKPIQGYTVIPTSDGIPERYPEPTPAPTTGRPLLGQGRRQEPPRNDPPPRNEPTPRMSVPGLIQLPLGPPPEPSRLSPRRADLAHSSSVHGSSYDRNVPRQQESREMANRAAYRKSGPQRTLFDPANPHKPIVVAPRDDGNNHPVSNSQVGCPEMTFQSLPADQGNNSSRPTWYDPQSESFRSSKSHPHLLMDVMRCDMELSWLLHGQGIAQRFNRIQMNRKFFQNSLRIMLANDLRFCQMENVEQHMWKIAFHNVIEALRKAAADEPEAKEEYKLLLFNVIDEGTAYFESLLEALQEAHKFNLETYLEPQPYPILSGLGYIGLAIVSCQKILIFLGDLARYREMTSETSNYGKAKSWYTKANLTNPKNGRPYNQLAILALYARRKLDAVYLYMRSLMASNPFQSARESLVSLFDENRKKYEQQERKRRDAKEASSRKKEAASTISDAARIDRRELRREIWIHPLDGRRTRRTTSANGSPDYNAQNSDDEELAQLPSIEVNKRFVTSYLNVQGKLYTKIGMETFQECGVQMLREFRALLQQTPLPVNQTRLLQLLALNMFAVSNTQLKDTRMAGGCRSAWQECALVVSLEMFNILLERCNAMMKEQLESSGNQPTNSRLLGEDLQIILPAIKVWCDWLLCHSTVWNPPPTSRDYHVGPAGTPWTRLATLINLLSRFDTRQVEISHQLLEGYETVKLPEDVTLCGFTPLMLNIQEARYTPKTSDTDLAADCVRIERMLYFGRDFLCGLDPPVLKLKFTGPSLSEYVSVVEGNNGAASAQQRLRSADLTKDDDEDDEGLLDELELEEEVMEDGEPTAGVVVDTDAATDESNNSLKQLRQRKDELTQKHLDQQRRKQQLRAILRERVQVELEVRPKFLVADTNCYIDHLDAIVRLVREKHYTLVAPLVVLNELDGLCRSRLATEARAALVFLREKNPQIRYVTSKGAPLPNFAACTMNEENDNQGLTNDDRILQCCLGLIKDKLLAADEDVRSDGVRRLRREIVLLTDDRNLRVKSLARDVPVRDLPAFLAWSTSAAAAAN